MLRSPSKQSSRLIPAGEPGCEPCAGTPGVPPGLPISHRPYPDLRRGFLVLLLVLAGGLARTGAAQAPLQEVNSQTKVREISFKFVETQTLEPKQLKQQIATQEPSFWDD